MHSVVTSVLFSGLIVMSSFIVSTDMITKFMPVTAEITKIALSMHETPTYYLEVAQKESGFNPNATNPRSTSKGLYQFIDSTWEALVNEYGSSYGLSYYGRFSVDQSTVGAILYTRDNRVVLEKELNRAVTNKELYLAHFAGPQKALKLINAKPSALVVTVLGVKVVRANPALRGKTVSGAIAVITKGITNA